MSAVLQQLHSDATKASLRIITLDCMIWCGCPFLAETVAFVKEFQGQKGVGLAVALPEDMPAALDKLQEAATAASATAGMFNWFMVALLPCILGWMCKPHDQHSSL